MKMQPLIGEHRGPTWCGGRDEAVWIHTARANDATGRLSLPLSSAAGFFNPLYSRADSALTRKWNPKTDSVIACGSRSGRLTIVQTINRQKCTRSGPRMPSE